MTKFILIASGKGGSGKTTVAINLGTALTYFGRDAIVVDGDLNKGNISLHLGHNLPKITLHDVIKGNKHIKECIYLHDSGVKAIPNDISQECLNESLDKNYYERLPDILLNLISKTEYVIIDSPPGIGKELLHLLKASDEVIVVTTPDLVAVTDALKTIKFCENKGVSVIGVIVNKVKNNNHELNIENIKGLLDKPILATIPYDEAVSEGLNIRHPITFSHPDAPASIGFKKMAALLLGEKYMESIEKHENNSIYNYMLKMLGIKK